MYCLYTFRHVYFEVFGFAWLAPVLIQCECVGVLFSQGFMFLFAVYGEQKANSFCLSCHMVHIVLTRFLLQAYSMSMHMPVGK